MIDEPIKFTQAGIPYRPDNENNDIEFWSTNFLISQWKQACADIPQIQPLPCRANILYEELKRRGMIDTKTEIYLNLYPAKSRLKYGEIRDFKEEVIKSELDIVLHKLREWV